jgi:hypothetical protein
VQQLRAVLQSKRMPHELPAQITTSVLEETVSTFLLQQAHVRPAPAITWCEPKDPPIKRNQPKGDQNEKQ